MHEPAKAEQSIRQILGLAKQAKAAGARIVVTNRPSPGRMAKTDEQLKTQAASLDRLGRELRSMGLVLAYHNHDIELQNAHASSSYDGGHRPPAFGLVSRRALGLPGRGQFASGLVRRREALRPRVVELHVRQSKDNVWSETFGDGDIDYRVLANALLEIGVVPHVVLEQGPEAKTPQTMSVADIHRRSGQYAREVFAGFAKPHGKP